MHADYFPRFAARGVALLALIFALAEPAARAYNLNNSQWADWPIPLTIALGSPGHALQDGSPTWDAVAERAVNDWNAKLGLARFAPTVDNGEVPVQGDKQNTVAFSETIYGDEFGDETVAVTLLKYDATTGYINESDVLVNKQFGFDSYDGPLRSPGTTTDIDLHRVLLHEFGHVLGLLHPDAIKQTVSAVMNSVISDTYQLTTDDTDGSTALYGDPALTSLDISVQNETVEAGREKVYVTTAHANGKGHLRVIDPFLGEVVASVRTGLKPGVLNESDGGEHLYLGIDGKGAIDQIDPDTLAVTQEFTLGAQAGVTAGDIEVLPHAPESVLVSQVGNAAGAAQQKQPATCADFAVYDQGVQRPDEVFNYYNTPGCPAIIDNGGQTFYGFGGVFNDVTGVVTRFSLGPAGISPQFENNYLFLPALTGGACFHRGVLYCSDGSVDDLYADKIDTPFPDVLPGDEAYVLGLDPDLGQIYFVVPNAGTTEKDYKPILLVEDIATRSRLGSIALPRYTNVYRFDRWGANGLLFCASGGHMFFMRSTLIAPGPVAGPPVVVALGSLSHSSLDENGGLKAKLVVVRTTYDLSAPLAVTYTATGTSESGVDYRPLSGVVTIPAGQTTAKIKVVPLGSQFSGDPRTLQIRLTPNLKYRWGTNTAATVSFTGGG